MRQETSNKGAWTIVIVLTIILVVGLIWDQPMKKEEAIEKAREYVPAEFTEVNTALFSPTSDNDWGMEIWTIQFKNNENDLANVTIQAKSGRLLEGNIEDGETGEVMENL